MSEPTDRLSVPRTTATSGLPIPSSVLVRTAAYLRCYPYEIWPMTAHRGALLLYATQVGLPEPDIYLDNGFRSGALLPQLVRLLQLVAAEVYQAVLVPGPFVFSLDDHVARDVVRRITAHGCRLLELPTRWRLTRSTADA